MLGVETKGPEPCVKNPNTTDCKFCKVLTSDQRSQLSTLSYKLKNENREAKKDIAATPSKDHVDTLNPCLVDPIIGAVDGQNTLQSPGFSGLAKKKQKKMKKEKGTTSKVKSSLDKPAKSSSDSRSAKASH